ncbi:MAG: cell division protein [Ignavibacteriae bacterium]|nr:MAG: cell division protein [Ignavibacteriota bacterium]
MKNIHRILIGIILLLIILGTVLIFSTKGFSFFISHIEKVLIAVVLFFISVTIPYKSYKKISKIALMLIVLMLLLTLFIGPEVKGASRWLNLGIIRFQPSEFAKIFLLLHLAVLIEEKGKENIKSFNHGLVFTLIWIFAVCGLIFLQPNVSTAIIIAFTSFILLYVGGARLSHLLGIGGSIFVFAIGLGAMVMPHAKARILPYIKSFLTEGYINFQVLQSKIALGSGGLLGLGIGKSRQSDLFLPESHNDFIFSVIGEELGFFGAMVILVAYMAIFIVGLFIAKRTKDEFGQLLAFSISFTIVLSAFIHVAIGLGLLPTTGITLPFISFGGTSIIIFSISIGILINISLANNKKLKTRKAQ